MASDSPRPRRFINVSIRILRVRFTSDRGEQSWVRAVGSFRGGEWPSPSTTVHLQDGGGGGIAQGVGEMSALKDLTAMNLVIHLLSNICD